MTSQRLYDLAVANDDDCPDDVCPGCGADITGWRMWEAHIRGDFSPSRPIEWHQNRAARGIAGAGTAASNAQAACPWTRDYLVARVFRRRTIAEGEPVTTSKLGKFENSDVVATAVAVTNAGDGLSKALKLAPEVFHLEDELTVALHCVVAKVRYEPTKDDPSSVIRVHVLRAGAAVIIDDETVEKAILAQAERIRLAEEEAEGVARLEFGDSESDE